MPHVITQHCCNDAACVAACPVDCIHPGPGDPEFASAELLYIDPEVCIDCGACVPVCPVEAIYPAEALPEKFLPYIEINAAYARGRQTRAPSGRTGWHAAAAPNGPLRVAIVGTGPAGAYAAQHLLAADAEATVSFFDRLPTPWGLVRAGVAPDHQQTKAVTATFAPMLMDPRVRVFLNVSVGRDITHSDLMRHHHAVIYAVGADADRRLGIPGEDLPGSSSATEFVAWYNGHPDASGHSFDLTAERAVVIGNGNVALDVARILCAPPDLLAGTDIADHALTALRDSAISEVVVLGRRGPAQAAYTSPELLALSDLPGVDVVADPAEVARYDAGREFLGPDDVAGRLKADLAVEIAARGSSGASRRIVLRYLASPVEIVGDGRVEAVRAVRNDLVGGGGGALAQPGEEIETIPAGLVLRSVGYRARPIPGLPFHDAAGTVPNLDGRVLAAGQPLRGVYTAGWVKRGPSGVIGTNRECSRGTVAALIEDFRAGMLSGPAEDPADLDALLAAAAPDLVDRHGWILIDRQEREGGRAAGRPRVKLTAHAEMLAVARSGKAGS